MKEKSRIQEKSTAQQPGPGSYQIPSTIQVHNSLSKQSNQKRFKPYDTLVPGPGQYNSNSANNVNGPKALILSKAKQSKQDLNPGPGSYEPDFKKVMKSQSGYQLPKGKRSSPQTKQKLYLPGPGTYQTSKSTLQNDKNAIKFGPQRKIKLADQKNVPGPGQYNTLDSKATLQNAPRSIFGKAGRSQSYNNIIPGPGAYNNKTLDTFDATNNKKGFSISFKGTNVFDSKAKIPGPGSYHLDQIDKIKFKTSSFSMPKSPRLKVQNQRQMISLPGPEKYNINLSAFEHKSYKIGKSSRRGLGQSSNIPGPGSYNIKNLQQLPKFSMPKSNKSWIKSNTNPGPGKYDPKVIANTQYQSVSINVDNRRPFYDQKKNIPGPGQYTITQMINKKGGFSVGHENRPGLGSSRQNKPGPGDYNVFTKLKGQKKQ